MDISIIISTWNNSKVLSSTISSFTSLRSCLKKRFTWELILVNNNSTDSTREVASSFSEKLPLKYVEEPVQGLARARNTGLKHASGELIVFTDDDVKPCEDWIKTYWEAYQKHPQGYAFGGSVYSIFEGKPPSKHLIRYLPSSVNGLDYGSEERIINEDPRMFLAANWACPKSAIELLGGFDESLGLNPQRKRVMVGEETNLMQQLIENGFKLLYLPQARVGHYVPKYKCTLKHALERQYGLAYYYAKKEFSECKITTGRVPRWLIKRYTKEIGSYLLKLPFPDKKLNQRFKIERTRALIDAYKARFE